MVKKLRLGSKFARELFNVKKTSLEVGLIELQNVIDLLALKMCAENMRVDNGLKGITDIHEELSHLSSGILLEKIRY